MPNIHKTQPVNINELFSRGRIEVPQYQRSYSWTEREVTEFLEDLFAAANQSETWFLGIVYTYHTTDEDGIRRGPSILLDGQQRMTTMFIFLKELLLYHEIIPDSDLAPSIRDFAVANLTSLIFEPATQNPRLLLDEANRNEFAMYLTGDSMANANFQFFRNGTFAKSHELVNDAIHTTRDWLREKFYDARGLQDEYDKFKRLVHFVLYNIELIEIQLSSHASFHNIFENINDRGRRLSGSDKFKNRYCAEIPRNQIDAFETDWFEVSKKVYGLKCDLDDDLFDFYFRSIGQDDLDQAGNFYSKVRKDLHIRIPNERIAYLREVWSRAKEMVKIMGDVEDGNLIKTFQGAGGNNLQVQSKVVNVLIRETWRKFSQFGVLVYALYLNFNQRNDPASYVNFLQDLTNAARFYLSAHLSGEGANAIRPYTIDIANKLLRGMSFSEVLSDEDGRLDFSSRLDLSTLDSLFVSDNKLSRLLLLFIQSEMGPDLMAHYDINQNWTLEHFLPIVWDTNWSSVSETDWAGLGVKYQGYIRRQMQAADLSPINKNWVQELLGNKFVVSWKQNNQMKNDGLVAKQTRIAEMQTPVIIPTLDGYNITDYKRFGVDEIIQRSKIIGDVLTNALRSKDLPI
jgi:hypothetical protein